MTEYHIYIVLSAIVFSSIASQSKYFNFKPFACEICLAFWMSIIYLLTEEQTNPIKLILISGATSQLTKITNILLIRLYGNIIGK